MLLTRDDQSPVLPLPAAFSHDEPVSSQELCRQLEVQLGKMQKDNQELMERVYDAEHRTGVAEARLELVTEALREKDLALAKKDGLIERQRLVLGLALGGEQAQMDDPMRHLWSVATSGPWSGTKRKFSEVDA